MHFSYKPFSTLINFPKIKETYHAYSIVKAVKDSHSNYTSNLQVLDLSIYFVSY